MTKAILLLGVLSLTPIIAARAQQPPPTFDLERVYEFASTALAQALETARQAALEAGTSPIPDAIRKRLSGTFEPELLARVRYRVGEPESLLVRAFAAGNVQAVTLIDVIVFRGATEAESDDALWAHELTHVRQYDRWGLEGFAQRYVRDSNAVEAEAYDFQKRYADRRGLK